MAEEGRDAWVLIRLSHTTVWLPERDAHELAVDLTAVHAVPAGTRGWEAGAIVPAADRWRGVRGVGELWSARARFLPDRDVALIKLGVPRWRRLARRRLGRAGELDQYLGVQRDVPGMTTQTMRGPGGLRLGLHLDNWDRLPPEQRGDSRNRVSLNLGDEPRWFMFVDHDVVGRCPEGIVPTTRSARQSIMAAEQERSPAIVRVRVPVGWAYIAPTEILLHDVWSLGERRGAFHASALGRFSPVGSAAEPRVMGIDADGSVGLFVRPGRRSGVPGAPGADERSVVAGVQGA
jgi:hypothetical protein